LPDGGVCLQPRRFVPFGAFPEEAAGAEALLVSRRDCRWITLPTPPREILGGLIRGSVTVGKEGSAQVDACLSIGGILAAQLREFFERSMSEAMRKIAVQQLVNQVFPRIHLDTWSVSPFDPGEPCSDIAFKGKIEGFAARDGNVLHFSAVRFPTQACPKLVHETRRVFPAIIHQDQLGLTGIERVTYTIPAGATSVAPENRIGGGEFGRYAYTVRSTPKGFLVRKEVYLYRTVVPPERWKAFSRFCREIDDLERRTLSVHLPKNAGKGD
ncbi:MAG: hypothetical protein ACYTHN_20470, partial [Planctomycetota bacterium]